ncbi:acetolactate synthase, large subunit [Clostridium sp. USBA 49]|uniref:biosynthetic-type acetolactate synthase large subunit n=1 Tax=Clostridium sp. USBA 49 TaxID=1881060 RepID=UPI0009990018|nr:biosynthetic-type acetolactate synthase large subunit [Clostridium sp. USBA 49]SKA74938.1 acetolactate synthase, large subunit [Clostridium sp. USBA 49]
MKYSGAAITIKLLERQGIKNIIGIPGGSNLPLYDALYQSSINHILARHEQGAAFIAQGMARSTGEVSVCFATSGPGATNLLTAIADAKLDSVPIISITGQVSHSSIGTDAFQEVDTYGLTIPITKHNFLVRSVEELFYVIPEAFKIAKEGRPGPVNIDIPKDIQLEEIEFDEWPKPYKYEKIKKPVPDKFIKKAAEMINNSEKPILYIGGGIISSNASEAVSMLACKNNIPVTSTLMALGSFNHNDLYLGMLGMHGAPYTNFLMHEADLIIALGVRFDDRAIGNTEKFCPNAKIIHIDIDESEINKIKQSHLYINGDIDYSLKDILSYVENNPRTKWLERIKETKAKHPFVMPSKDEYMHPINIIKYVSSIVSKDSIITTDVGEHQMWVAQVYPFKYPRNLLTSGGLGTMGFGLPAAIGAALANPDKEVICFSGDGSILMNIQELATLADLNLNVKILILNNGHLGLVRQQQQMFYKEHYIASKFITNPDFAVISRGFGVKAYDLSKENEPLKLLAEALIKPGPTLINIPIKGNENVLPIVPPGAGNTEMIGGEYYGN